MGSLFRILCLGSWLGIAVLLSGQIVGGRPDDWQGVWAGDLPGYGNVAVKISPSGPDQSLRVELWWLCHDVKLASSPDALKPAAPRLENGLLLVDRFDHTTHYTNYRTVPGLAFRLEAPDEMRLASYGIFDPIFPPVWANLVLKKDPTGQVWRNRNEQAKKMTDWRLTAKDGKLSPLPAAWPAEVIMPTALLFSYNSSLFVLCLAESKLPPDFLQSVCAMAQEVRGSEFQTSTFRALARNPLTTQEALGVVWTHRDDLRSWYLVAAHPHSKPEWRDGLVDRVMNGDDELKKLAAVIETGPEELYRRLIADGPARRFDLAGNFNLPAFVYELLAKHYAGETGQVLAKNPKVSEEILDLLAATKDRERKYILLANPSLRATTGKKLAMELSETASVGEYGKLALSRWAPPEFLSRCTQIPDPAIRNLMARSPHMDQEILLILANDKVRDVARVAREKLQERFPGSFTAAQPTWKPLESLAESLDVTEQCRRAIEENEIERVRMLLDYLRETMGLERCLDQNAEVLIKEYRPEIMDLFLASGLEHDEFTLAVLAGKSARNPQWLAYFKAHGVLDGKMCGQVFTASLADESLENLQALIGAGLDVNAQNFHSQTALHVAVQKRNQAAVEAIMQAGGNPEKKDSEGLTPLDRAVSSFFVPAIRRMDKAGRYSSRVDEFVRDFPSSQNGRLLGSWSNRSLNAYPQVSLILFADGTGRLSLSMETDGAIGWREAANNGAEVVLIDQKNGGYDRTSVKKISLNTEGTELSLEWPNHGRVYQLRRSKET